MMINRFHQQIEVQQCALVGVELITKVPLLVPETATKTNPRRSFLQNTDDFDEEDICLSLYHCICV